ncbi:hypothetical protein ABL78_2053 [Leptomonas seymouri]|uniref:Uncharacterized protein n=1 Tax=Leptomonas seymouri TaxID=5684 RepID=A0A0N0P7J3_LEPSE|nr:hypothetical protein ABL78_2053 [Leptomonas seymouri]|eukprot:KPI88859.1 hypothetical protein ABL78_2053 [Leptomonas seymouri]
MAAAPVGKWVVVRSDRLMLSVDKADHLYYIGRSRQLPSSQVLSHKYASREQLAVLWHPPHLYIAQTGKNPSFLGAACDQVPRVSNTSHASPGEDVSTTDPTSAKDALAVQQHSKLRFTPSTSVKEAVLHKGKDGSLEVEVPLSDPLMVTHAPDRHTVDASTLYFPDELGLPSLTVRFESAEASRQDATAAATTKTAAEMLAVPAFRNVEGDEDEELSDDEAQRKTATKSTGGNSGDAAIADGFKRPEWRGLLDVALQEQKRQDATRNSKEERSEEHTAVAPLPLQTVAPEVKAAPPAPSASIPFGSASSSRPAAATTAAPSSPHHTMGLWEWKQHAKGKDADPQSWRRYNRGVAELLEKSYRDPSIVKVKIPDAVMFGKPEAKGCTYGVCLAEKALKGAMIQYSLEDPGRFRVIRRTGGSPVDRKKARKAHVIPSSSDSGTESESEESFSDDDSDSDSEESGSSSSSSTSDERRPRKKRRH